MMAPRACKTVWLGLLSIALILSMAACTRTEVGTPEAGEPIETSGAPAADPTPEPAVEPSPALEPTAEPTVTPKPATETVKIFLVALEDDGKSGQAIGCGDSIVPVERQVTVTGDPIVAALEDMFSLKDRTYGNSGLYNVLYQSSLQVESIEHESGAVTVYLTGKLSLSGVCDNPRVQAQIEETVRQFPGVDSVMVYFNDTPLDELLSGKG